MKNIIKLLSITGIFVGFFIAFNAAGLLISYLFLVHPVGDTLAIISWSNWLISLAISILMIVVGILCSINSHSIYFQPAKSVKSSKKLIFLGFCLLITIVYLSSYSFFSPVPNSNRFFADFKMIFIENPIFIPGIIILFIGLVALKHNKLRYKEEINTEEQKEFTKKLKRLSLIIIIILSGLTVFNLYKNSMVNNETNNTINSLKNSEAVNKARNARIFSDISQARTVMHQVYLADNNYDSFNCSNPALSALCIDIAVNNPVKGTNPIIAISPASNSKSACIYSLLNDEVKKDYWYCADSAGFAGFCNGLGNNPSTTCRTDGTSAYCPSGCVNR